MNPIVNNNIKNFSKVLLVDNVESVKDAKKILKLINNETAVILLGTISSKRAKKILEKQKNWSSQFFKFTWHYFGLRERLRCEELAIKNAENIYHNLLELKKVPYKEFERLYQTDDISLVFKKYVTVKLVSLFELQEVRRLFENEEKEVVVIVSKSKSELYSSLFYGEKNIVKLDSVIQKSLAVKYSGFKIKAKYLLLLSGVIPWIVLHVRKLCRVSERKKIDYAIRVFQSDLGFLENSDINIDWPIDNKKISSENSMFIAETEISNEYYQKFISRNYKITKFDLKNCFSNSSLSFLFKVVFKHFVLTYPKLFIKILFSSTVFAEVIARGWFEYFRWKNFVWHHDVKVHLSYNHLSYTQIFRNIILSQANCKTAAYSHTNSIYATYVHDKEVSGRHSEWTYLYYDHYFYWCKFQIEMAKFSKNKIAHYHVMGPVFSSRLVNSDKLRSVLKEKWGNLDNVKVISVFPTSNGISAINDERKHYEFLKILFELLQSSDFSNLRILFKYKSKISYTRFFGCEVPEIKDLFEKLEKHPSFLAIDQNYSSYSMFELSDLVLSMGFASPSIEALIEGKPAFYFDAGKEYTSSYFYEFSKFVAWDYDSFFELLNYWLGMKTEGLNLYYTANVEGEYGVREGLRSLELVRDELAKMVD